MPPVAELPRDQLQPPGGPRELEPTSKVNGRDPASRFSLAASPPAHATASDALDVGEQIRRLHVLAALRATGILTDGELTDLKRRVLLSGSDGPLEARHAGEVQAPHIGGPGGAVVAAASNRHAPPADEQKTGKAAATGVSTVRVRAKKAKAGTSGVPGPVLDRSVPKGSYVTALEVVGTKPITWRLGGNRRRPLYVSWQNALDVAATKAAAGARPTSCELFSLRIELRLYDPGDQGSDLDNYVKPIQDALAERGVFGPVAPGGSPMKGDERVDHVDLRRRRVSSEAEAGVLAEVWGFGA